MKNLIIAASILTLFACTPSTEVREFNTIMYECKSNAGTIGFSYGRSWKFANNRVIVSDFIESISSAAVLSYKGQWMNDSTFELATPMVLDSTLATGADEYTSFLANRIIVRNKDEILIPFYGGHPPLKVVEKYFNP